jgi:hypothetical protein
MTKALFDLNAKYADVVSLDETASRTTIGRKPFRTASPVRSRSLEVAHSATIDAPTFVDAPAVSDALSGIAAKKRCGAPVLHRLCARSPF